MKNLKITLENGVSLTKLNTTTKKAEEFAVNPRFNSNNYSYTISEATIEDIQNEKLRLEKIEYEYRAICDYNKKVDRYNSAVMKSTNHHEFMNATNHLYKANPIDFFKIPM